MSDILVVKVNMCCSQNKLNDIHRYITESVKTGVVVLPSYCDAQVVPDDVEIRVKDLTGDIVKGEPT